MASNPAGRRWVLIPMLGNYAGEFIDHGLLLRRQLHCVLWFLDCCRLNQRTLARLAKVVNVVNLANYTVLNPQESGSWIEARRPENETVQGSEPGPWPIVFGAAPGRLPAFTTRALGARLGSEA